MNLKDRLFVVIDENPALNPNLGLQVPEFKVLYDADKTEEKVNFKKEMSYVYHMCEYTSPYYDVPDKETAVAKDIMGKASWKPTKRVKRAIEAFKSFDTSAEKRMLDSALATCEKIGVELENLSKTDKDVRTVVEEIEKEIKTATDVDIKIMLIKEKLALQKASLDLTSAMNQITTKLNKTVEGVMELRAKVTAAVYKGENAGAQISVKFIMDELMDELDYEQS